MPQPHIQPSLPKDPRKYLHPILGGPWLEDRAQTRWLARATALGAVLCLGGASLGRILIDLHKPYRYDPPVFLVGAAFLGGLMCLFAAGLWWAAVSERGNRQVCPQCLGSMQRTARKCPHCHYQPAQAAA